MSNVSDKQEMEALLAIAKEELTAEMGDGEWNEWSIEHPDFIEWCDEREMSFAPKEVEDPLNPKVPKFWVANLECQGFWVGPCKTKAEAKEVCEFLNSRNLGGMVIEDEAESGSFEFLNDEPDMYTEADDKPVGE